MSDLLSRLFNPAGLTPHGFCLLWEPWLIWSHAIANVAIGLAYFSIPVALLTFVRRRRDVAFKPVFLLFAAFILLCGAGHFADLLTLWVPAYGLEAVIKIATAIVSVATAVALWPLMPQALILPSPTQLQAANAALAAREAEWRERFLRAPVPLHTLDSAGAITGVSDRWLDLLGYQRAAVLGRSINDFLDAESAARRTAGLAELFRTGERRDAPRRFVRQDGTVLDTLVSVRVERLPDGPPWIIGAIVDVTEQRLAEAALQASEERLRQTQKMEALGQLAGGIAHDFNNVLQAVSGGVALIGKRAGDREAVTRLARLVAEAAARGSSTTRRLLAFARRGELRAAPVAVAGLLTDLKEILAHSLGTNVTIRLAAAPALPPLLADRAELETMLVNLATNARDAMPTGGTLTFAAAAEVVAAGVDHPAGLAVGGYLRLDVIDDGVGMDAATLARATEPFFTTKPADRGTGLGLATARGFTQQSGGALLLRSRPGEGTTVSIWLPEAAVVAMDKPRPHATLAPSAAGRTHRPAVLLVDDEPLVREVLAAELEDAGFRVTQVPSGAAALERLAAGPPVELLITDLSMPAMDGVTLIRAAQAQCPGLRAILITGYANDAAALALSGAMSGSFSLLRKPVSGSELAGRAVALLEGAGAG